MSPDTLQPHDQEVASIEVPDQPARPDDVFLFEGVEVRASLSNRKWRLRAAGYEVVSPHLGEATRVLFNPNFHGDTSDLIREILTWDATVHPARAA